MERKTLAIGVGVGMLGVAGVGLGAMIRTRRRRRDARRSDFRPRSSASDTGSGAPRASAALSTPEPHTPRTATRMVPGIPVGSGRGIDSALTRPDTDLGGGVKGDTTVTGSEGETGRDERTVRNDDHDRTTL